MTATATPMPTTDPVPTAGRVTYERLSALDASFLHVEGPTTPMHVGAVSVFEGAPFFDERGRFRLEEVQARVAERLDHLPRFRRKVMEVPLGQGRPVWVDDPEFDITRHVELVVLPQPGSRELLLELCERRQMRLLDRRRPLWSLTFVGGLDDGNVAMVERVHHALVDGVSGVDAAAALLDLERDTPFREPSPWVPSPAPGPLPLLAASLWQRATEPVEVVRSARAAVRTPRRLLAEAGAVVESLFGLGGAGFAPATSLNTTTVGRRRVLLPVHRSLGGVRNAAHAAGGTVNDAVLACVAGGVRSLLEHRGERVADRTVRVLVPVSIRADDEHLALGNRVTALVAALPIGVASPVGRLHAVRDEMHRLKAGHAALGTELLLDGADHLPPALNHLILRGLHQQPFVNLVVTNVPGPQCPLYFMGAQMLEAIPVVPLAGNLSLGFAVLSYDGSLQIALHADRDTCPDAHVVVEGMVASFDALEAAAG
jgi:WS/DGAT/MGAT family acyltransferase